MGYILFTASGTFSPSDHGLVVGDMINIVCVGGGGSGGVSGSSAGTPNAVAGKSSSFGNICTAAGGAAEKASGTTIKIGGSSCLIAGDGMHGWMPGGFPANVWTPGDYTDVFLARAADANSKTGAVRGGSSYTAHLATNGKCIGTDHFTVAVGRGGLGYGAGAGGGACAAYSNFFYGGGAGAIVQMTYKLTSTSNVAVTVGAAGINSGYSDQHGAPGCVAVFW